MGVAFAAYGTAVLPPEGNGLIATFVAAIALGIWRPDIRECFEERSEDLIEIVKLGVFLVFGATADLRPPVRRRLGRRGHRRVHAPGGAARLPCSPRSPARARWTPREEGVHGAGSAPKGVATMTFALLVLGSGAAEGERIANIAALAVLASVIAHGLTDQPGSEWIGRRAEAASTRRLPDVAGPCRCSR